MAKSLPVTCKNVESFLSTPKLKGNQKSFNGLHKGLKFSPQKYFKERWLSKQLESLLCFEQKTCRQGCFPTLHLSWGLSLLLTSQNIPPQNKHWPLLDGLLLGQPWAFLHPGSSFCPPPKTSPFCLISSHFSRKSPFCLWRSQLLERKVTKWSRSLPCYSIPPCSASCYTSAQ